MDGDLPLSKRIAAFRKLCGWTQDGLAHRLNRSKSWATKVELPALLAAGVISAVSDGLDGHLWTVDDKHIGRTQRTST